MSLWLAQATFVAVPAGKTVGPDLTASGAVENDTTVGKHQSGLCIQFRLKTYVGPAVLDPGKSYSMKITFDNTNGFVGTLTEAPAIPFVALRAEIHDPTPDSFAPSILSVNLAGERNAARWEVYDENTTGWLYAGSEAFAATIDFVDRSGRRFASSELFDLGGFPGYTVVVDEQPITGASKIISLEEAPE